MRVDFKCKECGTVEEITYAIEDGPPKEVECSECNSPMKRSWGGRNKPSTQVDEWFADETHNTIANKMATSRPSGKDKNLY